MKEAMITYPGYCGRHPTKWVVEIDRTCDGGWMLMSACLSNGHHGYSPSLIEMLHDETQERMVKLALLEEDEEDAREEVISGRYHN